MDGTPDRRAADGPLPVARLFRHYTVALTAVALALAVVLLPSAEALPQSASFWLLAAFVLAGELLPITVPRGHAYDRVAVSTAFGFAILLTFGLAPAVAVYVVASAIADSVQRIHPWKILFNSVQYALALCAAAGVLELVATAQPAVSGHLPEILLAALAFFVVNELLVGVGAALLTGARLPGYLFEDLGFQALTTGFLLALAPVVAVVATTDVSLVPLAFVPMIAIYLGGKETRRNRYQATHDVLTHLPNRLLLEQRMAEAISAGRQSGGMVSLLVIDLDNFKAVNDTLGHRWGDRLLEAVGQRLEGGLRDGDTLARLGGDEFAVVVPGPESEAVAVAERILTELDRPFDVDDMSLEVGASVGIATSAANEAVESDLLQHADAALYEAKEGARGWCVSAGAPAAEARDHLLLAGQLRRGIARQELVLHYQPKVALSGPGGYAVEALVRWQHPTLGLISPGGFLPLAEQTGVLKPLTLSVLTAALEQCRRWHDDGMDVRVSVNLSTRSLQDRDLAPTIESLLQEYQLPASALQFEITESRMIADIARARRLIEDLRAIGLTFAIDDFGTGYSSLKQLQQLPVDEIKVDRSFVMNMERDPSDVVLVRSTVELGRSLSLRVTAEGVENEQTLQRLIAMGCDYAQGFHLGRPCAADECTLLLRRLGGTVVSQTAVAPA